MKNGYTLGHVPISKMTLMTILKKEHISDFQGDGRNEDHRSHWATHFNLNAFETRNRRFAGQAVTDGVSISMLIDRLATSAPCMAKDVPGIESLAEGTVVTSVDPGFSDIVTTSSAVIRVGQDGKRSWNEAARLNRTARRSTTRLRRSTVADTRQPAGTATRPTRWSAFPGPCTAVPARMKLFAEAYLREMLDLLKHWTC